MIESLGFMSAVFFALAWYNILVVCLVSIAFIVLVFNEVTEYSVACLVATVLMLNYFGIIDLTTYSISTMIYTVFAYFLCGSLWSLFKYREKAKVIANNHKKQYPNDSNEVIIKRIKSGIYNSQIYYWIIFFPVSIIKFFLSDFVYYLISKMGKIYDYIARSVVNSL